MIQRIAKQDRAIVGGALSILVLVAWLYTIRASNSMQYMEAGYMFPMWAAMMVAMMTPSAAPMVFAFSRVTRSRQGIEGAQGTALAFLLGYLTLWTGFSVLATLAHTALANATLVSSMGASGSRDLSAALLMAAGFYQFSPWKNACLSKCRTPLGFLLTEWRDGMDGAFVMGVRHGMYCAGCCWLIMAALFVAGVMNLAWIAALTLVVLAEKALPFGERVSRLFGAAAVLAGAWLLVQP
jgi:predicted metal-binding membrane protein